VRRVLPVLLLFLPAPAAAQAKVRGESVYKPYQKIVLKAADVTSAKASFLWDVDGDADFVEAGDTLYVWAPPGAYRVRLTAVDFESKKVERARFAFKVEGDVPPSPPGPGPGPGPKPEPTDPLTKELAALYAADTTAGKAGKAAFLAALYRGATQKRADGGPAPVDDTTIATPKALLAVLAKASGGELAPADLKTVRARLSQEVQATLGEPDVTLDTVNRARAKALFLRLAAALETLK
jgi:hypothetical protein